ncbi:HSPB1-associated protein 1 isoform X1 [Eurytemora carolleeae]|uniref:HSPB1-associated protein 1 isoform X1 n=1 Tax=Eurytemora carolleeae TaxID=1294199 RepID=UPI000C78C4E9|nr:HSPB1-associated protein 1 isoform X1 [Eurytemora carolleeae]|eukprot:XP_023339561.1 HSPB1-associated protein 1-like isoform X1 [Eurytemora affinis]
MSDDEINFPRLLKNGIKDWEPLSWNLDKWKLELNRESLEIRTGKLNPAFNYPQWETTTKMNNVPSGDFFSPEYQNSMVEKGEWGYFDYKYMRDLFPPSTLSLFSWNSLGLKDRDGMDSTLWIGSQGAHTPCHQDSYGYNLVCQLVGTKKWILFPPNQTEYLKPSRVPYEESSVYSDINFHQVQRNPVHVFNKLQYTTPYIVTLRPGDVLYVPRHWWHFVQNITFSVSVNTWVECKEDNQSRLEESLVRIQAALLSQSISRFYIIYILNMDTSSSSLPIRIQVLHNIYP